MSDAASLGRSILNPNAPILHHRLPEGMKPLLAAASAYANDEVEMGFYIPQPTRNAEGETFIDLEARACYMLNSHDCIDVSWYVDTLINAYCKEWMALQDGDYAVCAQSLFLHNVVGGGVPLHTDDDDVNNDGAPQRTLVAMTYLNDGFEGGKIEFPFKDFAHAPQTGDVLIFPTHYPHLVYPLTQGVRHAWQRTYYIVDSSGSILPRT